tara:strand:- start:4438 stop:5550 length:1113 start_codon:yes stop_codon:yes gene_type:complete
MRFLILFFSLIFFSCACGFLFNSYEDNICDFEIDQVTQYFCEKEYLKSFLTSDLLKIDIITDPDKNVYKYYKNSPSNVAMFNCHNADGFEFIQLGEKYYEFCNKYLNDKESKEYHFKLLEIISEGYWGTVREKHWSMLVLKDINYLPLLLEYGYYFDSINDVEIFMINEKTLFSIEKGISPNIIFEHLGVDKKINLQGFLRNNIIKPLVLDGNLSNAFLILYLTEGRDYALPKAIFDYENDLMIDFRVFDSEKCELFKSREYLLKTILNKENGECWKNTYDYFIDKDLQLKNRYQKEKTLGIKKNLINYNVTIFELENKVTQFHLKELIEIGSIDITFYNLIFDNFIIICEKKEMCDYTRQVIDIQGKST